MQKYWHEAPQSEIDELVETGITWGQIMQQFKQPDWCGYHEALRGELGCWSLVDFGEGGLRTKISENFCNNCECFNKKSQP